MIDECGNPTGVLGDEPPSHSATEPAAVESVSEDAGGRPGHKVWRGDSAAATTVKTVTGFAAYAATSLITFAIVLAVLEYRPIATLFPVPGWLQPIWAPAFASALGVFAGATIIKVMFQRAPRRSIFVVASCFSILNVIAWIAMLVLAPGADLDLAPLINSLMTLPVAWAVLWGEDGWEALPGRSA